ncbi:MAG TPA: YfiR family protein [Candidatus Saccharimonadales bacterium]|nr:YfiR family protein [Candidatus Saccharimonadales bacterium]
MEILNYIVSIFLRSLGIGAAPWSQPRSGGRGGGLLKFFRVPRPGCYWVLPLLFFSLSAGSAWAQVTKEYQVKAVFLWRLAQFTEWPPSTFTSTNSPVVIGVIGENPFGAALEAAVRGETAHGHPITVRHFTRLQQIRSCHILFISGSESDRLPEVLRVVSGASILTVSDIEGFARSPGGMVRFMTEQGKIKLKVNIKAVSAAHLVLDARLLRAAEIIGNE